MKKSSVFWLGVFALSIQFANAQDGTLPTPPLAAFYQLRCVYKSDAAPGIEKANAADVCYTTGQVCKRQGRHPCQTWMVVNCNQKEMYRGLAKNETKDASETLFVTSVSHGPQLISMSFSVDPAHPESTLTVDDDQIKGLCEVKRPRTTN